MLQEPSLASGVPFVPIIEDFDDQAFENLSFSNDLIGQKYPVKMMKSRDKESLANRMI